RGSLRDVIDPVDVRRQDYPTAAGAECSLDLPVHENLSEGVDAREVELTVASDEGWATRVTRTASRLNQISTTRPAQGAVGPVRSVKIPFVNLVGQPALVIGVRRIDHVPARSFPTEARIGGVTMVAIARHSVAHHDNLVVRAQLSRPNGIRLDQTRKRVLKEDQRHVIVDRRIEKSREVGIDKQPACRARERRRWRQAARRRTRIPIAVIDEYRHIGRVEFGLSVSYRTVQAVTGGENLEGGNSGPGAQEPKPVTHRRIIQEYAHHACEFRCGEVRVEPGNRGIRWLAADEV